MKFYIFKYNKTKHLVTIALDKVEAYHNMREHLKRIYTKPYADKVLHSGKVQMIREYVGNQVITI